MSERPMIEDMYLVADGRHSANCTVCGRSIFVRQVGTELKVSACRHVAAIWQDGVRRVVPPEVTT